MYMQSNVEQSNVQGSMETESDTLRYKGTEISNTVECSGKVEKLEESSAMMEESEVKNNFVHLQESAAQNEEDEVCIDSSAKVDDESAIRGQGDNKDTEIKDLPPSGNDRSECVVISSTGADTSDDKTEMPGSTSECPADHQCDVEVAQHSQSVPEEGPAGEGEPDTTKDRGESDEEFRSLRNRWQKRESIAKQLQGN